MTTTELVVPEVVAGLTVPAPIEPVVLSDRQIEMIRRQVLVPSNARPPTDVELDDFGQACMYQRLNPFDRQIYLAWINGRWSYFIGVHGRLTIAMRTGLVTGMIGPLFCHAKGTPERKQGPPDWEELWEDDGPPHAAKFVVMRRGMTTFPVGAAPWELYAYQTGKDGRRFPRRGTWESNPALMLGYKAITRALNLVFPDVMPPDTGRDGDVDVDESVGYVNDEAVTAPTPPAPSGAATAREVVGAQHSPATSPRTSFIVPDREQVTEMGRLLERNGLAGADHRDGRLAVLSEAIGRPVETTADMDRDETRVAIEFLRARWYEHSKEEPF